MSKTKPQTPPPSSLLNRVILAIIGPLAAATLITSLTNNQDSRASIALFLGVVGVVSGLLGWRWYGLPESGLRGGRPLFAGIGFAVLAWVIVFLARLYFVDSQGLGATGAAAEFLHLLLFEALCVQLFAFGPFFRAVVDWRGPLTAAIAGGVVFAFMGLIYFAEPFGSNLFALFYLLTWGILYGVIRLRAGSLLGTTVIQAMQGFTTWFVLLPPAVLDLTWLNWMHGVVGLLFIVIIWRLWPKTEEDYRV